MEKLIASINKMLEQEYFNGKFTPKVKFAMGPYKYSISTEPSRELPEGKTAVIYMQYYKDGKQIKYYLMRMNDTLYIEGEFEDTVYNHFVNTLLFGTGPLRIAEVLNGTAEPIPEHIFE